ncbi:von Willebrand factor type A domain-containing protein [Clostridium sp. DSM 8431]|uniref:vWA domain-containing protein n=1 Tax=Clostridium sp. DSM 8431 TaxID=1761781 RepID=UPI0008F38C08|nr:vWA domain-containing protein [Clostridium sp. DSM 8431]SFU40924.1 von Willebrand factor type A domain-containing protein [Clostridium sp. DSM 8431]
MKKRSIKFTKQKIKLLALFVSVALLLGVPVSSSKADIIDGNGGQVSSEVKVDKTAKYNAYKNTADVTLQVDGKAFEKKEIKADIVLCVDTSGSMNKKIDEKTRLDYTKEGIKKFCSEFKKINSINNDDRVMVSLCQFNYNPIKMADKSADEKIGEDEFYINLGSIEDANDCGQSFFTSNMDDIIDTRNEISVNDDINKDKFIGKLSTKSYAGTNTEAGIRKAEEILSKGREGAEKYIVLFTDGLPTISINNAYGNGDKYNHENESYGLGTWKDKKHTSVKISGYKSEYSDIHFINAQEAYNELLGGISEVGGIVKASTKQFSNISKSKYSNEELKFYTIAATAGLNDGERTKLNKFLGNLNNTGGYIDVNDDEKLKEVFEQMAMDINREISSDIAKSPVIYDIIPKQFEMPTNEDIAALKEKYKNSIDDIIISPEDNRKIVFKLKNITEAGFKATYSLKPSNYYFYGENIPTNVSAVLNYKDPINDTELNIDFPVPNVTIPPKTGKVEVEKKIVDSNGIWIDSNSGDETFPILLQGNDLSRKNNKCSYNFNMIAEPKANSESNTKSMEFIMKDYDTDINNAESFSENAPYNKMGWVGVGTYDVSEIVPMNYTLHSIEVYYLDDNKSEVYNASDANKNITIDEQHKNIKIVVNNEKVNDNYWYDKEHVDNNYDSSKK